MLIIWFDNMHQLHKKFCCIQLLQVQNILLNNVLVMVDKQKYSINFIANLLWWSNAIGFQESSVDIETPKEVFLVFFFSSSVSFLSMQS